MTTLDQLLYGVRQVESGGNYSVVNSIGAVGAYQVMKANIPSWTKRALGYSMTWQQFRNSRSAQDTVARVILGGYYKQYGAAGAASMWFSGQPNPNSRASDGGNTVSQYVAKVLGASGGGSVTGSSSGSSSYSGTSAVTPKLDKDELASQYGLSAALINSSKELKNLFNKAVSGQWTAAKFGASLKNTKWWRTQSSTLRKYLTTKYTDPASFKQQQGAAMYAVNSLAVTVGLGNQISGGKASKLLKQAMYNKSALGWTDARIKDWLGAKTTTHGGVMWGEAGEAFDKLHTTAYLNGMKYSSDWYKKNAVSIASGKTTTENIEASIRKSAAGRFSAFSEQIKAGQNVMDLAAPYIKSAATLLELPDTEVDLSEKLVYNAMHGSHAGANFPLWQFENAVRNDPRWRKTNNARESLMTVAHQVAKDFGMAY
jgi:hypothetical protein